MTFDDENINNVWNKGREIPGRDPDTTRTDAWACDTHDCFCTDYVRERID